MQQPYDEETASRLMHDIALMLMYLSSWKERNQDQRRFWKNLEFDLLDRLAEEGLIDSRRGAKSAYLTEEGERQARELLARYTERAIANGDAESQVVRLYAGGDGQSHFEDVSLNFVQRGDQSELAELRDGSGILVRRFEAGRNNPWHHAPGRYAVFTLRGAVDITVGDGTLRRIGAGDVLIAEDLGGQGHATREVGREARISVFVPLP